MNRKHLRSVALSWCLCMAGLTFAGCGGGTPSVSTSTQEAEVTGKVTYRGKAVSKGSVSFDPSNIQRTDEKVRTSQIGEDGTYTITTLIGENQISADSPEIPANERGYATFTLDVQSGSNTFDIDLSTQ